LLIVANKVEDCFLMGLSLLMSEFIGFHSMEMSGEEMPT